MVSVRGDDIDFNVTEETLGLQATKGTTTGEDIFQQTKMLMSKFNLPFGKLHRVSTDGAPAKVESKNGFISKVNMKLSRYTEKKEIFAFHCIIHRQNLCARSVKFLKVMSATVTCVTSIKSTVLTNISSKISWKTLMRNMALLPIIVK